MPVTTVFKQPTWQLEQLQIGAADIVATISAAHSAWGWIGGLTGISSILGLCQRKSDISKINALFECAKLENANSHILNQTGLHAVSLAEDGQAFGGTLASRLVGTTLCALAHNMNAEGAIGLFVKYFIDSLFKKGLSDYPGSRETLTTFLYDNSQSILNEGTTHQLGDRFDAAISDLGMVYGQKLSSDRRFGDESYKYNGEAQFIDGFLRWLLKTDAGSPYYTRSAIVGRIAACLRCIGYKIGKVIVWDGTGKRPSPYRGLVLVTGGSSNTDELSCEEILSAITVVNSISHYHWNTVGGMLWNSFDQEFPNSYHESFQQDFDDIDKDISQSLELFQWSHVEVRMESIQAYPIWSRQPKTASRIAMSLATIFFRSSVDRIAIYYEKIATESYLKQVKERSWWVTGTGSAYVEPRENPLSAELQSFLVITASICISVLGKIAGDNFKNLRHSTADPVFEMRRFRLLCSSVDDILHGGCEMSRVVKAVAAIHCAADLSLKPGTNITGEDKGQAEYEAFLIGWRSGRYAVLPNLLFQLSKPLRPSVLDLRCTDMFIANLPVAQDGAIHSITAATSALGFSTDHFDHWQDGTISKDIERADHARDGVGPIVLGPPETQAPDKPLYLSIERPPFPTGTPEVSLCGRINGESVGSVLIQDVLKTLALSWSDAEGYYYDICATGAQHHATKDNVECQYSAAVVYNMPVSRYCEQISVVPRADQDKEYGKHSVYVKVEGDTPWTVFLAGQSPVHNRVAFGCADCAVQTGLNCFAKLLGLPSIIGYQ